MYNMAKKRGRRAGRAVSRHSRASPAAMKPVSDRIKMVTKNFSSFAVLAIISYIFYKFVFAAGFWDDLFFLLLLVFGFVALALLIAWMVLLLIRRRRK
jgi:hypothetical protein